MPARRALLKASAIVLISIMPWFLALTSILPLISSLFLRVQYARPDVPPSMRFRPEERQTVAEAAAHYLVSREGIEYLGDMRDAQGLPLFNERELTHMVDVKLLLGRAVKLDVTLGLLLAACLGFQLSQSDARKRVPFYLVVGAMVTLGLCVTSVVVTLFAFDWLFVEFHHLFFLGDTWLFPRTDTLIQLFPEMFWFNALESWIVLIVSEAIIIGAGAYIWIRVKKRRAGS